MDWCYLKASVSYGAPLLDMAAVRKTDLSNAY